MPCWGASGGVMFQNPWLGSGAQRLATLGTASVDDLATRFSGHARAKAVAALAHQVRGLVGAFHRSISILIKAGARFGAPTVIQTRSLLRQGGQVKPRTGNVARLLQHFRATSLGFVSESRLGALLHTKMYTSDQAPVNGLSSACATRHLESTNQTHKPKWC